MTTTSNTDIQELKEFIKDGFNQLDRKIDDKFNQLDRKIDTVKSELKQEISEVKSELKQEISEVRGEVKTIDARMKNVETAIQKIPEITEKKRSLFSNSYAKINISQSHKSFHDCSDVESFFSSREN